MDTVHKYVEDVVVSEGDSRVSWHMALNSNGGSQTAAEGHRVAVVGRDCKTVHPLSGLPVGVTSCSMRKRHVPMFFFPITAPQEGRRKGDPAVGRYIADTLAVVPRFSKLEFERLFSESMQDALMVTYLSNLLRAQIALAEKLGTSQLPIM
jgi:hypothetical protein